MSRERRRDEIFPGVPHRLPALRAAANWSATVHSAPTALRAAFRSSVCSTYAKIAATRRARRELGTAPAARRSGRDGRERGPTSELHAALIEAPTRARLVFSSIFFLFFPPATRPRPRPPPRKPAPAPRSRVARGAPRASPSGGRCTRPRFHARSPRSRVSRARDARRAYPRVARKPRAREPREGRQNRRLQRLARLLGDVGLLLLLLLPSERLDDEPLELLEHRA